MKTLWATMFSRFSQLVKMPVNAKVLKSIRIKDSKISAFFQNLWFFGPRETWHRIAITGRFRKVKNKYESGLNSLCFAQFSVNCFFTENPAFREELESSFSAFPALCISCFSAKAENFLSTKRLLRFIMAYVDQNNPFLQCSRDAKRLRKNVAQGAIFFLMDFTGPSSSLVWAIR